MINSLGPVKKSSALSTRLPILTPIRLAPLPLRRSQTAEMGAGASSLAGVHVVVVGGGFGAKNAAQALHAKGARVTLVCPAERFYDCFGGVRAVAVEKFEDALLVPYSRIFSAPPAGGGEARDRVVVRAFASGIDTAARTVRVRPVEANGEVAAESAEVSAARTHYATRARARAALSPSVHAHQTRSRPPARPPVCPPCLRSATSATTTSCWRRA